MAPSKKNVVFHIQDVHGNEEAQRSISKTIKDLVASEKIDLIALEGAFGSIDASAFQSFPGREITNRVADALLKENVITGSIHAAFTNATPMPRIVGVDDIALYNENVRAVRDAAPLKKTALYAIESRQSRLDERKKDVFNGPLAVFDAHVQAYRRTELSMGKYAGALARHVERVPNQVRALLSAIEMESRLDIAAVERERTRLLSRMAKEKKAPDLSDFPAMRGYLSYLKTADSISIETLSKEMTVLESEIYRKLARTNEEVSLIDESDGLHLKKKLLNFSLTKDEWRRYSDRRFEETPFERFYMAAEMRDKAMVHNVCAINPKKVILVTGGFHARGIDRELERKGFEIVTIVPKITKVETAKGTAYLSLFTREKTELERIFDGEKLFLTQPVWTAAVRGQAGLGMMAAAGSTRHGATARETFRPFISSGKIKTFVFALLGGILVILIGNETVNILWCSGETAARTLRIPPFISVVIALLFLILTPKIIDESETPPTTAPSPRIIPDLIGQRAAAMPDHPFIWLPDLDGYRQVTYRQFLDRVVGMEKLLFARGIKRHDRVMFLSHNRFEYLIAAMAVWKLGAVVVPVNVSAPAAYLAYVRKNSKATSIIISNENAAQAKSLEGESTGLNVIRFDDLPAVVPRGENLEVPSINIGSGDVAIILYTSGSAKFPKGVPLTHANVVSNRTAGALAWEGVFGEGDKTVGWLAYFHVMGLIFEFLGNMAAGAGYVFPRAKGLAPTPNELLKAIENTDASVLYASPSMMERIKKIAEDGDGGDNDALKILRRLKAVVWGGASLPGSVAVYFLKNGVKLAQGYGLTETTGAILWGSPSNSDWRVLKEIPGFKTVFLPAFEMGEGVYELILKNGPTVMSGYIDNDADTAAVFPNDGEFHTGDLFKPAGDGYVYVGRKDDVFNLSGGEKINPLAFENDVEADPRVKRAALVGDGMPRSALFIELHYELFSSENLNDVENEVWALVDAVNAHFPKNMWVKRENIFLITPGEAPLPVGPKGNLSRPQLAARFAPRLATHFKLNREPRLLFVGGSFDDDGGRKSSLIEQIKEGLPESATIINGGDYALIKSLLESAGSFDVILWFPHVPNEKEKLRNIRELYPDKLIVTSKRNHGGQYSISQVAKHAADLGSDLVVEFSDTVPFAMRLMDPYENVFEESRSPVTLAKTLSRRISELWELKVKGLKVEKPVAPLRQKTELDAIIVGGVFDETGGKPSEWVTRLAEGLPGDVEVINGGHTRTLDGIIKDRLRSHQTILWFPEVSPKRQSVAFEIKKMYPFRTLITAFFNPEGRREFQSMINEALGTHSNLWIEFTGSANFRAVLRDPLSNEYGEAGNPARLAKLLLARLETLDTFTRQRSTSNGVPFAVESNDVVDRFISIIKERGEELHRLVHPEEGVYRFLGNASFRASAAFDQPELQNMIFVSRRNVDKRTLSLDSFVQVGLEPTRDGMLSFRGPYKPSVDSPIQARLYSKFPDVNFILHAHVYVEGAPFTAQFCPCGSLEEVEEVVRIARRNGVTTNFAINLLGHGSIIFAQSPDFLEKAVRLHARPTPEPLNTDGTARDAEDERAAHILRTAKRTEFIPVGPTYFEGEEFAQQIRSWLFPESAANSLLAFNLRRNFANSRAEHYKTMLGLIDDGEKTHAAVEAAFAANPEVKFYAIKYNGAIAGRVVFDEKTRTFVDGVVFEKYRGNHLGDVILEYLQRQYGSFTAICPGDVPFRGFLLKRGFTDIHTLSIGGFTLYLMGRGSLSGEALDLAKKAHAQRFSIYADALLTDRAVNSPIPIESALYREFPGLYDLLYQRFSKRRDDFLSLVRKNTPAKGRIIDAAAGTGEVSIPLLADGYDVLSTDLNEGMLAELTKKAQAAGVRPRTMVAGFLNMQDVDGFSDTLTVRQAISYLKGEDRLREAFALMKGKLKPGGKLIFNAPNYRPDRFSAPTVAPYQVKSGGKTAIVRERNSLTNRVLTHFQDAIVWNDAAPNDATFAGDKNSFKLYTKEQFEAALKAAGFSSVQFLSSGMKPYEPTDPVLYVVATKDWNPNRVYLALSRLLSTLKKLFQRGEAEYPGIGELTVTVKPDLTYSFTTIPGFAQLSDVFRFNPDNRALLDAIGDRKAFVITEPLFVEDYVDGVPGDHFRTAAKEYFRANPPPQGVAYFSHNPVVGAQDWQERVHVEADAAGLSRKDVFVIIGDAKLYRSAAYAAARFHRGIPVIYVPTIQDALEADPLKTGAEQDGLISPPEKVLAMSKPGSPAFTSEIPYQPDLSYRVKMTRGIFDEENAELKRQIGSRKFLVVLDESVGEEIQSNVREQFRRIMESRGQPFDHELHFIVTPGGESLKNERSEKMVQAIHRRSREIGFRKTDVIVAIGGGALIDVVGFAASRLNRRTPLIRIPTTLLGQIDGSIGAKNAVNRRLGEKGWAKNFDGVFDTPEIVFIDPFLLKGLPQRIYISGLAEAIKVALIKDRKYFKLIEDHLDDILNKRFADDSKAELIMWLSVVRHLEQIETDPNERKLTRPLDYGHQWGHQLEKLSNFQLLHGEGVAIGTAIDSVISYNRGYISQKELNRILNVIERAKLPTFHDLATVENLWPGLESFQKHLGGELTISLLDGIGRKQDVHALGKEELKKALEFLKRRKEATVVARPIGDTAPGMYSLSLLLFAAPSASGEPFGMVLIVLAMTLLMLINRMHESSETAVITSEKEHEKAVTFKSLIPEFPSGAPKSVLEIGETFKSTNGLNDNSRWLIAVHTHEHDAGLKTLLNEADRLLLPTGMMFIPFHGKKSPLPRRIIKELEYRGYAFQKIPFPSDYPFANGSKPQFLLIGRKWQWNPLNPVRLNYKIPLSSISRILENPTREGLFRAAMSSNLKNNSYDNVVAALVLNANAYEANPAPALEIINKYDAEITKHHKKVLTVEEEKMLFFVFNARNTSASLKRSIHDFIATINTGLIYTQVNKLPFNGERRLDIAQDTFMHAFLGLREYKTGSTEIAETCIESFQFWRDVRFSTHASWKIMAGRARSVEKPDEVGRGATYQRTKEAVDRIIEEFTARHGHPPTLDDVIKAFGGKSAEVIARVTAIFGNQEVYSMFSSPKEDFRLADLMPASIDTFDDEGDSDRLDAVQELLRAFMKTLSSVDQIVIKLSFGLGTQFDENDNPRLYSRNDVAKMLDITAERVRQLYTRGIRKLREAAGPKKKKTKHAANYHVAPYYADHRDTFIVEVLKLSPNAKTEKELAAYEEKMRLTRADLEMEFASIEAAGPVQKLGVGELFEKENKAAPFNEDEESESLPQIIPPSLRNLRRLRSAA